MWGCSNTLQSTSAIDRLGRTVLLPYFTSLFCLLLLDAAFDTVGFGNKAQAEVLRVELVTETEDKSEQVLDLSPGLI